MSNFYDFNSTFFLSLATMTFGFCGLALGYALKSKCSSVKLCGCIEIQRDIEAELEEDRMVGVPSLPSPPNEPPAPPTPAISRRESHSAVSSPVISRRQSRLTNQLVDFATSLKESMKSQEEETPSMSNKN